MEMDIGVCTAFAGQDPEGHKARIGPDGRFQVWDARYNTWSTQHCLDETTVATVRAKLGSKKPA